MKRNRRTCPQCRAVDFDKGRAADGRRAYRCQTCRCVWTEGLQGKTPSYSALWLGYQFSDSGASADPFGGMSPERCTAAVQRLVGGLPNGA